MLASCTRFLALLAALSSITIRSAPIGSAFSVMIEISPETLSWIASGSPPPTPPSSVPSANPVGMLPICDQSSFAVAVFGPEPSTLFSSTRAASTFVAEKFVSLSEKLTLIAR